MNRGSSARRIIALFKARNMEFLRDRGALSWSLILPLMIIAACSFAFRNTDNAILTIGVIESRSPPVSSVEDRPVRLSKDWNAFLESDYFRLRRFGETATAIEQLGIQRVDLLVDPLQNTYWLNAQSNRSRLAVDLLRAGNLQEPEEMRITGDRLRYIDWVIPGVLGMNMMFGSLFGAGYVIVRYRNNGVLKRLQATPVNAFEFLTAQVLSRMLIMLAATITIFAGCQLFLDFVVLGSYALLLLIAVLGALSMVALGLLVSSRTASEELAGGLLNLLTWPMMLLSEVWFSLQDASSLMQQVSSALPLTHIVVAAREVMLEGATINDIAGHLITLTAMTVVFLMVAARLFRWSP